jgi:hypothetical protein
MTDKTLRDEIAIAALIGQLSTQYKAIALDDLANWSYKIADAMLAEREKGQTDDQ